MAKDVVGVKRKKGFYKEFDILIERRFGWLYYSVLNPNKDEIIGGYREDTVDITEFYNFLEKQVDEYILHPYEYEEGAHDVEG